MSGWLGLPLRSDEFTTARSAPRRGRLWWMLGALVIAAVAATGVVIARPWSTATPAPAPVTPPAPAAVAAPVAPPPAPVPVPAAAPQSVPPPVVDSAPAKPAVQEIRRAPARHKKAVPAKKRATKRR